VKGKGIGKVALVLSAGSARGLAHIGVIQVLEENQIPFDLIIGCSMGAMVGSLYACDVDFVMLGKMLDHMNTSILFDIHVPRKGFISGKKIDYFLNLLTKSKSFDELNTKLILVATDLVSGNRVLLEEGKVAEAVRASISIPGIFYPVEKDGMILVDGAVTDRLPIEVAYQRGASLVIASDVWGTYCPARIRNTLDVIMVSLDIMQKCQVSASDEQNCVIIRPDVAMFSSRDFHKSRKLIELGRQAAEEKLDEILEKIELLGKN
jgi:NTE family protein